MVLELVARVPAIPELADPEFVGPELLAHRESPHPRFARDRKKYAAPLLKFIPQDKIVKTSAA